MANENWMEEARESGWLDPGEAQILISALKEITVTFGISGDEKAFIAEKALEFIGENQ